MTREHVTAPVVETAPPAVSGAPAVALPRSTTVILALQRSAGNAAVARMLARAGTDEFWELQKHGKRLGADTTLPDMYTTFGVERCTPLDELYPSAEPSQASANPPTMESAM